MTSLERVFKERTPRPENFIPKNTLNENIQAEVLIGKTVGKANHKIRVRATEYHAIGCGYQSVAIGIYNVSLARFSNNSNFLKSIKCCKRFTYSGNVDA